MHIAIVGPIATEHITPFLGRPSVGLPKGYAGAPLLSTLIAELLSRGHRVSAFTTSLGVPISRTRWVTIDAGQFQMHYIGLRPHAFRPKFGFVGRAVDLFSVERSALVAAIRQAAPDVVHGHWSYEFGLSAITSGIPHVVTCHDAPHAVLKFMPNLYRFVRYLMARHCLKNSKVITAVSPYLRDVMQPYCKTHVAVVPNPLPSFLFDHDRLSGHRKVLKESSSRIAMVINGWGALKNAKPALLAFGLLKKQRLYDVEMHLFGADFGPGEAAEQWCRQQGLTKGLVFHGYTAHREMLSQLESMHFMIHPALEESCPMGIAEAMSLGLPIIGGEASGGVPWVIGDGGITTDVTSSQAIAAAVVELVTNKDVWQRCSAAALHRSQRTFSAYVVADLYEEQYRRALLY